MLSFLTDAVDIFRLLVKNALTIVLITTTFWPSTLWFSQLKFQYPIIYEKASLAACLEVTFDWLIRTFSVALNNASHRHIIHKIRRGNGEPSTILNNYVFMIWNFHAYGSRNIHFTTWATLELLLGFFQIFICRIACNMYNFSFIGQNHACV